MTGYTRADTPNNIADGNIINAADLDGEYDAIALAFSATVGHAHDGSTAEGQPITKIGPAQDIVATGTNFAPKITATVDIGTSALKFKDFYFSGAGNVVGTITAGGFSGPINGTVGATTASTGAFTTLSASSTVSGAGFSTYLASPPAIGGTAPAAITGTTITASTAFAGPHNGTVGATTPSTGAFTTLSASSTTTLSSLTASTALALDASKNIVSVTNTGTGNNVLATSPTLVTPVLGTPTSVTLTNATGLPVSTGISGLGTGIATFLATPSSANLASAISDETGTGNLVFATSPTLITPALGTPSALVGTNITGTAAGLTAGNVTTNANLTGAITSTGNATLLGSFTSANLSAALTDETGSGSAVFATSPTLVTPALGTPSSATLTNATGLPISTGVSGLGTGIATFLATPSSTNLAAAVTDETGSGALVFATSPTLVTPALGTPSSATLTNATGLPISTGVSGLGASVASFLATPSSANLAAAVTDETGTGSLVFATSPTFVTPNLGTPASGVVTNLTGTASININGTVGATTTNTGSFTSLTYSTTLTGGTGIVNLGSGQFYKDATGKVGIGTAAPAVTLAVSGTDAMLLPNGTTAQRPTGAAGYIRYNSSTGSFEGYTTAWGSIGGGATGAGGDQVFYQNGQTVNTSYSITAGTNAGSFGPISVASGATVTVPTGSVWSIV